MNFAASERDSKIERERKREREREREEIKSSFDCLIVAIFFQSMLLCALAAISTAPHCQWKE